MLQVLTTTGARPFAFRLCCKYMKRQTYKGPVRWVIVDDGEKPTSLDAVPEHWELVRVRPKPYWSEGENTQCRNLLAGLSHIMWADPLAVVEDDDWYHPTYLQAVVNRLHEANIVGESDSRKYNVRYKRARELVGCDHSSLCATGFIGGGVGILKRSIEEGHKLVDIDLWRHKQYQSKALYPGNLVVGLKGLPGRKGIDSGHKVCFGELKDPSGALLRSWIGVDAEHYMRLPPLRR